MSPHSKTVEKSVPEEDERVREGRLFEELDPEAAQFIAEIDRKMGNANWQVAAWFKFAASPTLRQLEGVALEDRKRILTDAIIDMTADAQTPNMRWLQAAVIKRAEQLKEEGAPGEQKHAHANRMWHVWTDEELDKYMAENPDWSIPT